MADDRFISLREEAKKFYDIRNYPTPQVEYEEWATLPEADILKWRDRLQEQSKVVRAMIAETPAEAFKDRGYHELRCYFHEECAELKQGFKAKGIQLDLN